MNNVVCVGVPVWSMKSESEQRAFVRLSACEKVRLTCWPQLTHWRIIKLTHTSTPTVLPVAQLFNHFAKILCWKWPAYDGSVFVCVCVCLECTCSCTCLPRVQMSKATFMLVRHACCGLKDLSLGRQGRYYVCKFARVCLWVYVMSVCWYFAI